MAMLVEEWIQSIELLLKAKKKQQSFVDPDLDPVLLVPGIGGSILNAVDDSGRAERVWVRILGADYEFRTKLWSRFDPSTGKTMSLDEKTRIVVPEDRYGLSAIDVLDPDMIIGQDGVSYYHDMIEEMIKWGFQEGETLFGFGYDFRQSNRLQETLDRFASKLDAIHTSTGGKKLIIISHSMGGLLVKCFMCLHGDIFEKHVKSWIAIAAPFQGAPGYITTTLLNGVSFVEGWERNFFISKWSMQQLLIQCPSIYELMACPKFCWGNIPLFQLWREKHDNCGNSIALLESYEPKQAVSLMIEALSSNMVGLNGMQMPLPLNLEILKWANKTREILSHAKVPGAIKFYNIYGTDYATPHTVCYGSRESPILDLKQLLSIQAKYICVNGDGTVPAESAKADGLDAVARVGVPANHRGIISSRHVFRILKHWLKAGEPDPYYNPLNDYVIIPTAFELERHHEEWDVASSDRSSSDEKVADYPLLVGALSISHDGKVQSGAEAEATVVHPQCEGKQLAEVRESYFGVPR
ncbi:lecithin-cholesterol acyltransferase-like 4 [Elaeis guineensis]|uniref:Lecithin-cholesterol acyltransferase-like 4 n=1 Tax=Elaeis guineensis var. tenera TaxID=51953 RepID=A0A6I9S3X2_ELAGV|nr:lecithin-cholesterol acyltransferase-like 4 [Elaeis guineensis]